MIEEGPPRSRLKLRQRKLLGVVSHKYLAESLSADNIWPIHDGQSQALERWIDWHDDTHRDQDPERIASIDSDLFDSYDAVMIDAQHLPTLIDSNLISPISECTDQIPHIASKRSKLRNSLWSWGIPICPTECVQAHQYGTPALSTWSDVLEFARSENVVLHLAHRTPFLLWRAVSASQAALSGENADGLDDSSHGIEALELLSELYPRTIPGVSSFSAAQTLELMASDTLLRMCPFVPKVHRYFHGRIQPPYARLESAGLPSGHPDAPDIKVSDTAMVVFSSQAKPRTREITSCVDQSLRLWFRARNNSAHALDIDNCGNSFELAASSIVRSTMAGNITPTRAYRRLITLFESGVTTE